MFRNELTNVYVQLQDNSPPRFDHEGAVFHRFRKGRRRCSGSAWMLCNSKVSHTNILPLQACSTGRFLLCVCWSCFSNTPAWIRRCLHPFCLFWPFLSLLRWIQGTPCDPPPYRRIWTEHDHAILISLVRFRWSCILRCQAVCMCAWERVFSCIPVCTRVCMCACAWYCTVSVFTELC